jgi:hypothetical protein
VPAPPEDFLVPQRRLLAVVVSMAAFVPAAVAQDTVDLQWKFEKDKPIYQELTTKTTQVLKVQGNDITQDQEQTFYFSWTLVKEDKDKKTLELKQKIEGVKMKFNMAGQPIVYDSTNPGNAQSALTEFFKALIGTEFTITLDTTKMVVTDVKGRDDFLKKLVAANAQMENLLKQILSEESLKQMADPTFGVLPGKPVKIGDKWERKSTLSLGPIGTYDNVYTYTYEGKDKDLDKIKVDIGLTYKVPAGETGGLPFKITSADLKPKDAKGSILFNNKEGRVASSTMSLNLEGKISIEIGGNKTDVELKQTQTTDVKTFTEDPLKKK